LIEAMADKAVTIRTRKFMTNRLLSRKQFVSFDPHILSVSFILQVPKKRFSKDSWLVVGLAQLGHIDLEL
jgi:hypothetical protein